MRNAPLEEKEVVDAPKEIRSHLRQRQIGQTGVTVRPKLFISVGISGQIQHTAGMDQSAMIISINNDPNAPIHQIADYSIIGDLNEVLPKMIASYKKHSK